MVEQGDIVLIPIPFTDLSSNKRCPVIVISQDSYNSATKDMIVVAMTSNPSPVAPSYGFVIQNSDLLSGRLNHPGTVRVDKIYTLSQSLIAASFGKVNVQTLNKIHELLTKLVSISS